MPYFVCQNDECGHRFFDKSELAFMGGCPECGEDEVEPEESGWEPRETLDRPRDRAARVAAAAQQLLARHGVVAPPIDVEDIASREGLTVKRRSLGKADGTLRNRVLTVNADHARVRQRFTIAHELGHLALHADGTDDNSEREADQFANIILVPRAMLRHAFASTPDADALCRCFNVSREALWIALTDVGLDRKLRA
jgi:predicted  nucleic acid-binding Zn-ribbon protein